MDLTRNSKRNFYQNYFRENNNNLIKVWQGIKEIINVKFKSNGSHLCVMENDNLITNPTDVSNSFKCYYTDIAENIINKREYVGDENVVKYLPN